MSLIILHLNTYGILGEGSEIVSLISRSYGNAITDQDIATALLGGHYIAVATCESADMEAAFSLAQNIDHSWSRHPPDSLRPFGTGEIDGMGYRSTMTGDLIIDEDRIHIVASHGFREIDLLASGYEIRTIDGQLLIQEPAQPAP